jgi:hypothetical protein
VFDVKIVEGNCGDAQNYSVCLCGAVDPLHPFIERAAYVLKATADGLETPCDIEG